MLQNVIEEQVEELQTNVWELITELLNFELFSGGGENHIRITVRTLLVVSIVFVITYFILKYLRRLIIGKLLDADKAKFDGIFSFSRYFIYLIVILITFDTIGININAIFAASAALLVGVGLALQTFIQDILSGIFILLDQTVHVGDVVEIEDRIGRVEEIKLRTTRAVTIDNKVLIIPNHKYLTSSLYNWTQNGTITRESVTVGVAYGSDTSKVKDVLLLVAAENQDVLKEPKPLVYFTDFGDSSLNFKLVFSVNDSFMAGLVKSDLRFEIDRLFREGAIEIPFPQRDIHIKTHNKE